MYKRQGLTPVAPATQPYPPVVIRGMAVAALALLGEAGEENETLVAPLLTDPTSANCLNMAKLNLYQCLAVAKPYYEDIFCLGEHALAETAGCVAKEAGSPDQLQLAQGLPVTPAVTVASAASTETAAAPAKTTKHKRRRTN